MSKATQDEVKPAVPGKPYYPGVDSGRIIASFGVILIHISPSSAMGERLSSLFWVFSVSFFLIASIKFFVVNLPRKAPLLLLNGLVSRIGIPFLMWTILYVALFYAKDFITKEVRPHDWLGVWIYGQSAVHLYFLPMLASMLLLALFVYQSFKPSRLKPIFVLCASLVTVVMYVGYSMDYTGWRYLPAFPLFLIFGSLACLYGEPLRKSRAALIVGVALLVVAILAKQLDSDFNIAGVQVSFVLGGGGFYLMSLHLPKIAPTFIGSATYGVYLSHFMFLEGAEFLLERLRFAPAIYSLAEKLMLATLVFLCSICFTLLLRKSNLLTRLLLGETPTESTDEREEETRVSGSPAIEMQ